MEPPLGGGALGGFAILAGNDAEGGALPTVVRSCVGGWVWVDVGGCGWGVDWWVESRQRNADSQTGERGASAEDSEAAVIPLARPRKKNELCPWFR